MGKGNKSKKQQDSADDAGGATKSEQKRQAVLLADSFVNTFRPLSLDRPKVLCPLNNVSLLDYAMDFLAGVGIEELVVVCVTDAVEAHVQQHAWSTSRTIDVVVVKDSSLTNTGDALREVDKRNLIQCDPFVLMFGDVVTNVDIVGALAAHKARRKKDSSAIMTLLLKQVGGGTLVGNHDGSGSTTISSCRIRATTDDLIVGLDPTQENRVVLFDDQSASVSVSIPCPFLKVHSKVELHCDLMDTGIYICSPDVLARFSDEFDYLDLRRQFITNSVAEEEEGLQNRIHAHILRPAEYGARVQDFRTYHAISQDMLQRWCYPVVPDNLPSGYEKQYRYVLQQKNYLYRETKCSNGDAPTKVGRSSICTGPGMIGSSCRIGEDCTIQSCVIGNQCRIGSGVTLKESHLWDSVTVEEGATVLQSILSHGCVIKGGAVVRRGCVIGKGCVIGENVVIPEFTRITLAEDESGDDFDDDDAFDDDDSDKAQEKGQRQSQEPETVSDHAIVGPDGMGRAWEPSPDDDSEDDDDDQVGDDDNKGSAMSKVKAQSIGFGLHYVYQRRTEQQREGDDGFSDGDDDNDQENMQDFSGYPDDGAFSFGQSQPASNLSGSSGGGAAPSLVYGRTAADVVKDLKEICMDFEETSPIENLSIELNSYKFSQNATYSDCTMAATLAILDRMQITKAMSDGKLVGALKARLEYWAPLLQKMSIGQEEEKSIVLALERAATSGGEIGEKLSDGPSFRFLLQTLHDEEIVSEEAILSWAAERKAQSEDSPIGKLFRLQSIQDFLEWLEEESEDDDDEEDEDDSDED